MKRKRPGEEQRAGEGNKEKKAVETDGREDAEITPRERRLRSAERWRGDTMGHRNEAGRAEGGSKVRLVC